MRKPAKQRITIEALAKPCDRLVTLEPADLMPLPPPYDEPRPIAEVSPEQRERIESSLDGVVAVAIPKPAGPEAEAEFVKKFLSGLEKLLTKENNWTFLQPLLHSLDYCVQVPDLQRLVPGLRGERAEGDLPADLQARGASPHHQPVHQEEDGPLRGTDGEHYRAQLHAPREARRAGLPVHAVPQVRPGLPPGHR